MFERLIVVRHGQTVDNARGVAQGWRDSALSDLGREQARRLATRVRDYAPTSIYCSTLARAVATAEIIGAEVGLAVEQIEDFKEMNCGEWEGVSFDEVRAREPEAFRAWFNDPTARCPGGESFSDLLVRVERAIETVAERERAAHHRASRPLVVGHGLSIRVLATGLLRLPLERAKDFLQDNAAINIFEWRADRVLLRCWNDVSHHPAEGER